MKSFLQCNLLVIILCLNSPIIHAEQNYLLSQWVTKTLMDTLSISYDKPLNDYKDVKDNYSINAWSGMTSFLGGGGNLDKIRSQKLTLHPVFEGEPVILGSGKISGMNYWVVNQIVLIPEFDTRLNFKLNILEQAAAQEDPYLIQSLKINVLPTQ
ncbi:DotI/IcmL/TraM family protein [Legionella bononiensis]|uniref:DotI/IcmL/TraM family protein n=1 Tax=Legionella bononiensis TaxID=2793102 RepID=A0ABS1W9A8_9GAMM|nr:DotI/IcmL/TraM family protein [Legionella bononiensis]MBL7480877.1 DotI/IcmL/TraM family protein [Legionella bononiensis]MBL7525941.1 DotI/IcmL/TraM family protein [Legionella bononiensis]MBL7563992.1 DotI/IcmL/TraM family protein [Legionella bononiensis]